MGEDTPPEPPSGECSDCCDDLPASLLMMIVITINGSTVYTGTIGQLGEDPCNYAGDLYGPEEEHIFGGITFCVGGENIATLGCSLHPTCIGRIATAINPGCFPVVWGVSDDGRITYHVT